MGKRKGKRKDRSVAWSAGLSQIGPGVRAAHKALLPLDHKEFGRHYRGPRSLHTRASISRANRRKKVTLAEHA